MVFGLLTTLVLMQNAEDSIAQNYRQRPDLFVHGLVAALEAKRSAREVAIDTHVLATETSIEDVELTYAGSPVEGGADVPGLGESLA